MSESGIVFGINEILEILPHRYPFLLLDRVIEFVDSHKIVGLKNVSINEGFFNGHFPEKPVMPGVLILEAMAQTGAVMAIKSTGGIGPGKSIYLVGAERVKWKKQVVPGDTMRIEMTFIKKKRPIWLMEGVVKVGDVLVAAATISAAEVG